MGKDYSDFEGILREVCRVPVSIKLSSEERKRIADIEMHIAESSKSENIIAGPDLNYSI